MMFKWQNIQMVERGENCKNQASIQLCMYVYELFMSMQKTLQWVEIRKKMSITLRCQIICPTQLAIIRFFFH